MRRFMALLFATLLLAGCGAGVKKPQRSPVRSGPSPRGVIRAWVDTLRTGDTRAAAAYFALPSLVSNGTGPIYLHNRAQARRFNQSLPCGAILERTYRQGRYTVAVFRLTERPGPGRCGSGTGDSARTAFIVRKGKIREWRRLADPQPPPAPVV